MNEISSVRRCGVPDKIEFKNSSSASRAAVAFLTKRKFGLSSWKRRECRSILCFTHFRTQDNLLLITVPGHVRTQRNYNYTINFQARLPRAKTEKISFFLLDLFFTRGTSYTECSMFINHPRNFLIEKNIINETWAVSRSQVTFVFFFFFFFCEWNCTCVFEFNDQDNVGVIQGHSRSFDAACSLPPAFRDCFLSTALDMTLGFNTLTYFA